MTKRLQPCNVGFDFMPFTPTSLSASCCFKFYKISTLVELCCKVICENNLDYRNRVSTTELKQLLLFEKKVLPCHVSNIDNNSILKSSLRNHYWNVPKNMKLCEFNPYTFSYPCYHSQKRIIVIEPSEDSVILYIKNITSKVKLEDVTRVIGKVYFNRNRVKFVGRENENVCLYEFIFNSATEFTWSETRIKLESIYSIIHFYQCTIVNELYIVIPGALTRKIEIPGLCKIHAICEYNESYIIFLCEIDNFGSSLCYISTETAICEEIVHFNSLLSASFLELYSIGSLVCTNNTFIFVLYGNNLIFAFHSIYQDFVFYTAHDFKQHNIILMRSTLSHFFVFSTLESDYEYSFVSVYQIETDKLHLIHHIRFKNLPIHNAVVTNTGISIQHSVSKIWYNFSIK